MTISNPALNRVAIYMDFSRVIFWFDKGKICIRFLFSIFLSDLEEYLLINNITGLQILSSKIQEHLSVYLLMFVLLYADDTIILAESANDFQNYLTVFEEYCKRL